jgi:hypothetical protein
MTDELEMSLSRGLSEIRWNLGCRTLLISNRSVPEHKTKTETHRFPNRQTGNQVRQESVSYVAASAQCSLLLEFAVPFLDFLCVLLFL